MPVKSSNWANACRKNISSPTTVTAPASAASFRSWVSFGVYTASNTRLYALNASWSYACHFLVRKSNCTNLITMYTCIQQKTDVFGIGSFQSGHFLMQDCFSMFYPLDMTNTPLYVFKFQMAWKPLKTSVNLHWRDGLCF